MIDNVVNDWWWG